MLNQSTSQSRLQCDTAKVIMVVQLFMPLPLIFYTLQRCLHFPIAKILDEAHSCSMKVMCLPSIYLYNKQQTNLPSFIFL